MNNLMYDGKKSVAERSSTARSSRAQGKLKREPVEVFHEALDNVKPSVEVRSRRVGGATYQVPVEVRPSAAGAGDPLADHRCAQAQRKHHGRASGRRAARCRQQPRHRREEARRHPQDGRRQQSAFSHYRW
jgi:small subunit ribosomal protein S7